MRANTLSVCVSVCQPVCVYLSSCMLISFPSSSSSLVRQCQVSVVLSAIIAVSSSSRLCVACVHGYTCMYLGDELSQLYHCRWTLKLGATFILVNTKSLYFTVLTDFITLSSRVQKQQKSVDFSVLKLGYWPQPQVFSSLGTLCLWVAYLSMKLPVRWIWLLTNCKYERMCWRVMLSKASLRCLIASKSLSWKAA